MFPPFWNFVENFCIIKCKPLKNHKSSDSWTKTSDLFVQLWRAIEWIENSHFWHFRIWMNSEIKEFLLKKLIETKPMGSIFRTYKMKGPFSLSLYHSNNLSNNKENKWKNKPLWVPIRNSQFHGKINEIFFPLDHSNKLLSKKMKNKIMEKIHFQQ